MVKKKLEELIGYPGPLFPNQSWKEVYVSKIMWSLIELYLANEHGRFTLVAIQFGLSFCLSNTGTIKV